MRIVMTGATGFIGSRLVKRLINDHYEIVALVRNPERAADHLGGDITCVSIDATDKVLQRSISGSDAVVNLAGEPIIGSRWTKAKKDKILRSRIGLTRSLVDLILLSGQPPAVLLSASAVGFYGNGGDDILSETHSAGRDFLSGVCQQWEAEALRARGCGIRVVTPRIGVVLGTGGGALTKMLPVFKLGLGGRIGSGDQYMPWIHLDDLVELFVTMLGDSSYSGALNATAPEPVTNRAFTRALGAALHRPASLPVPAIALNMLFGEASEVLLNGQHATPDTALRLGFSFRFPSLGPALNDILRGN